MTRIYAHRGYHRDSQFPENTIPAFEAAIQQGADGLEFDVHLSRDGKAIVFHDKTLHKIGIPKAILELSLEELKQIEVANGVFLPTLAEVIGRFGNRTFLNIEIKSANAASEVARLISKCQLELSPDKLIVSSFLEQPLLEMKKIDAQIPTGLLYMSPWGKIKRARQLGCVAIHPFFGDVSTLGLKHIQKYFARRNIQKAQKRGFLINPWTVNTPKLIEELIHRKITAIITDNLKEALALRAQLYKTINSSCSSVAHKPNLS
ncbi:MAG: glycerophosphodiester phosphodiesterase [Candidatus Hodarchaeales archaeon]|jgi:glycerophosphoryl diester phosphodiesterase